MSIARHHAEWLSLVPVSGPFLRLPVLMEAFNSGFEPPDLEQECFERNKDAMRARAKEIPDEIEQETEAIRARLADTRVRMFPVAVTFLVPENMTGG